MVCSATNHLWLTGHTLTSEVRPWSHICIWSISAHLAALPAGTPSGTCSRPVPPPLTRWPGWQWRESPSPGPALTRAERRACDVLLARGMHGTTHRVAGTHRRTGRGEVSSLLTCPQAEAPAFDFWWDELERSVRVEPGQVLSFLSSCYTIKPAGWHPRGWEQKAPRASERPEWATLTWAGHSAKSLVC